MSSRIELIWYIIWKYWVNYKWASLESHIENCIEINVKNSSKHLIAQSCSRKHSISENVIYEYITMWIKLSHTLKMKELRKKLQCYLSLLLVLLITDVKFHCYLETCVGSKLMLIFTVNAKRNVSRLRTNVCWWVVE